MGGKGYGVNAHGHYYAEEEVKMPDSIDTAGRSKAHG